MKRPRMGRRRQADANEKPDGLRLVDVGDRSGRVGLARGVNHRKAKERKQPSGEDETIICDDRAAHSPSAQVDSWVLTPR